MLSEIDSIGMSTCNLGELTFESLLEVRQDLQSAISNANLVQASIKEIEQKLQALIDAPPPKNNSDAFK